MMSLEFNLSMARSNYRTTADAGIPLLLHIEPPWPRAAECGRWAER